MKFKDINDFSITECCEQLNLRKEDLPEVLNTLNKISENDQLLINHLEHLINEDNIAIKSCRTIEQYEKYLSTWIDGLHQNYAKIRIAQLIAESEELSFYKKNKNKISGLETYIKRYPNGKFTQEAKASIVNKKKTRKKHNIALLTIAIIVCIAVCLFNYLPVSYIDISEDVSFGKRGGNKTISISTDANDVNIDIEESSDWIKVNRNGELLSINVLPNAADEKTGYIIINTYSSFFGMQFNCISKKIKENCDIKFRKKAKTKS